jgi:hypothetical protein
VRSEIEHLKAKGRFGDDQLAHFSSDELELLSLLQGGISVNPDTGLPEFFSFKKVLKGIAKAAAGITGAYFGGPAGAAIGTGLASAALGDNMSKSLTNGLMAGLGSYGVQQSGIGDSMGISSLSKGADLLGRQGGELAITTASGSGAGGGMSSLLPMLGLGVAAAAAGAPKAAKIPASKPDTSRVPEYEKLDRETQSYQGDPLTYGQFDSQFTYFDDVHPDLKPIAMKYGGNVSEGGKKQGGSEKGGQGHNSAGGSKGNDRGTIGQQQDRRNMDTARRAGNSAPGVGGGGAKASGMSTAAADRMMIDKYMERPEEQITSDKSYWDSVRNLGLANTDYQNYGQGFMDDPLGAAGRIVGGIFGIGEIDPTTQALGARATKPEASWGIDPIGALLGGAGLAGAVPFGTGGIWQGLKALSGYQGPVYAFDGNQTLTDWRGTSALDNLSGMFGGGFPAGSGAPGAGPQQPGNTGNFGTTRPNLGSGNSDDRGGGGPRPAAPPADEPEPTGRTYNPLLDPYSYGQFGPQHAFFTGEIPFEPIKMAGGGGVYGPPTGGMSDAILARVSPGEHVIDAETVSMLGDGNNDAGHAKIEQFKAGLRKQKRSAPSSRPAPEAKGISSYMRAA